MNIENPRLSHMIVVLALMSTFLLSACGRERAAPTPMPTVAPPATSIPSG